jgi:predicted regulator of amino acid metabolism with ACT domain
LEDIGKLQMFDIIMRKFKGSPSQQVVIKLLLTRGFSVNDKGRVVSGNIEIPHTQIAGELGIDRRVVDSTTSAILGDENLKPIFQNISSIPSLRDLAPVLKLSVLTVEVHKAGDPGIVSEITSMIAKRGISIRQTISEDPEFTDKPKLYIITNEQLPGELVNELISLEFVRKIGIE